MSHELSTDQQLECLNCGTPLLGQFCSHCGQASHEGRHPTIAHFGHELVHEFVHVDGKIFRTLKALLFQPGLLTQEYWQGRITPWIRPLRIFLVVVALNLLIVHDKVGPMNFQVGVYRDSKGQRDVEINSTGSAPSRRKDLVAAPEHDRHEFEASFRTAYSSIRYFSVILYAAGAWLLFRRRQKFFVNQLVASFHIYSFWYLMAAAGGRFDLLHVPSAILVVLYLFLSIRRLYGHGWLKSVLQTALLASWLGLIELVLAFAAALMVEHGWVLNLAAH